ncbi:MAG: hypothetical protein ABF649_05490 [Bacillus sp. (in: firmicutes)]
MRKILITCIPAMFLLTACHNDIPDPKVKPKKETGVQLGVSAQTVQASPSEGLFVQHFVKGDAVYVECKVASVSFRENSGKKQAKIILTVDGLFTEEYHSAAFVVRGLKPGKHKISLEVVNEIDQSYHLGKEFTVTI